MSNQPYNADHDGYKNDAYAVEYGLDSERPTYSPRPFDDDKIKEMSEGLGSIADYSKLIDVTEDALAITVNVAHTRWLRNVSYEITSVRSQIDALTYDDRTLRSPRFETQVNALRQRSERLHLEWKAVDRAWGVLIDKARFNTRRQKWSLFQKILYFLFKIDMDQFVWDTVYKDDSKK